MQPHVVDAYVRSAVVLLGLLAVIFLATVAHNEAAGGALLTLLAAAVGYLFRSRIQPPTS